MKSAKKLRHKTGIVTAAAAILLLAGLFAYFTCKTYTCFVKTYYTVKSNKIENEIRIAHLTDLHSVRFGRDNCRLIDAVAEESPDIIAITGDMFSKYDKSYESTVSLIEKLSELAPVYYAYGNHELAYNNYHKDISIKDIKNDLTNAGAFVLDKQYRDIEIGHSLLRVGGLYGFLIPDEDTFTSIQNSGKLQDDTWESITGNGKIPAFSDEFQKTDRFTLLLSHRFESFLLWGGMEKYDGINLVLSGHVHGGQIVLPFVGPLYGQIEGLFPKFVRGQFTEKDTTLILSAGLGNHFIVPRINNPGELVIITVAPSAE